MSAHAEITRFHVAHDNASYAVSMACTLGAGSAISIAPRLPIPWCEEIGLEYGAGSDTKTSSQQASRPQR
jgi:hypothetical protein